MKFGLRKKIGNKLGKAKQFAKGKLERIDSALDSAAEKVFAAGYNTFNTKSKKYLALRVLCLAGLGHIAFESGDGVIYVDDTAIREQASSLDIGSITSLETKGLHYINIDDRIEIRRDNGEKIMQFNVSEKDVENLSKYIKIENEDSFSENHKFLDKRLATVGDKMFVEEYDKISNETVSLKEYTNESDMYSKLNDAKDLVGFINAISFHDRIKKGKDVFETNRYNTIGVTENSKNETIIEIYDLETNSCIKGESQVVLRDMLERLKFKKEIIDSMLHTKSEDKMLNGKESMDLDAEISNVDPGGFLQGNERETVCRVYSKDCMKYLKNGEIIISDDVEMKEPDREELSGLIRQEVNTLKTQGAEKYVAKVEQMLQDESKASDEELKSLYELIIATKNNKGYAQMRKIEREYKKEKKENKELIEQNLAEDETINTIDKERYVEIMNMEITRVLEQMIVEDEMASENKDKMQKLYKDTGYNMSGKKASNNYDKVYEERVTKHEYAATECLKESDRLEKTRDAVNFMSLCEKTTIIFEKEIQDRNFEKTVEQATAASEVIEAGDNIIYGGMENNNEIAREEVETIDRIMQDMKDEEFIIPGISEEKTEENMTALNPNIFNEMEFDDVVESLEDYGVYAAYDGERYIGETYVNLAPAEIEQDEEEQFDY